MARGPATGYVFAIRDPFTNKFIWVGNSRRPWENINIHLYDSSNPKMKEWVKQLNAKATKGLQVLQAIICDRYHGEDIELPPVPEGMIRIEWEIFGEEQESDGDAQLDGSTVVMPRLKKQIVEKLLAEGHPLINASLGRPKRFATLNEVITSTRVVHQPLDIEDTQTMRAAKMETPEGIGDSVDIDLPADDR